jgi:hypothetical protein
MIFNKEKTMLSAIIILLILNILLNLITGFLCLIVLGHFGGLKSFRFEFEPFVLPDDAKLT